MLCSRCPHHVRHGNLAADRKTIEFKDRCGLKMRQGKEESCDKVPFQKGFNYVECDIYQVTFKSSGQRNDCIPTSDFQYSDSLSGTPLAEMELL
jgi:hypothetical protein